MTLRLNGSTSGYSEIDAPAIAGDQVFTLPTTGGTLDRINRAGNILQVVNATYSTLTTNSTNVFADTGLTASITPTFSSSKILVCATLAGAYKDTNNTALQARLVRGTTSISNMEGYAAGNNSTSLNGVGSISISYLDSPATTSSTTYKVQFASSNNNAQVAINVAGGSVTGVSSITLLEVAA